MNVTIRKGQVWVDKKLPSHRVKVVGKGRRGGWNVLTATGKMHNTTEHTLKRFYMLEE